MLTVFLVLLREGLETALFLLALFRSAATSGELSPALPLAGLAGLAVAVLPGAIGEVENVIPGINRTFTLNLKAGAYVLSCPGGTTAPTGTLTVTE